MQRDKNTKNNHFTQGYMVLLGEGTPPQYKKY